MDVNLNTLRTVIYVKDYKKLFRNNDKHTEYDDIHEKIIQSYKKTDNCTIDLIDNYENYISGVNLNMASNVRIPRDIKTLSKYETQLKEILIPHQQKK